MRMITHERHYRWHMLHIYAPNQSFTFSYILKLCSHAKKLIPSYFQITEMRYNDGVLCSRRKGNVEKRVHHIV